MTGNLRSAPVPIPTPPLPLSPDGYEMTRPSPPSHGFESRLTKPAPRKKLGEEVAQYLREALMAGRYQADQRLGVEDLAEELGV